MSGKATLQELAMQPSIGSLVESELRQLDRLGVTPSAMFELGQRFWSKYIRPLPHRQGAIA